MNRILIAIVAGMALSAGAQTVTIFASYTNKTVSIESNQVARVLSWSVNQGTGPYTDVQLSVYQSVGPGSFQYRFYTNLITSTPYTFTPIPNALPVVAGPAQLRVSSVLNESLMTIQITTDPASCAACAPSGVAVVPTDATGPVQIVMESSQDLVNWVPSLPGTYGANSTNRFFRVRAVRQ